MWAVSEPESTQPFRLADEDEETIDEILQRPLDWSRQAPLALYLVARKAHKFPAVLVVLSANWVDDPHADQWDEDGRARESAADFTPLDKDGAVGLLDITEQVSLFTLDGQHRLMGVQGAERSSRESRSKTIAKSPRNLTRSSVSTRS